MKKTAFITLALGYIALFTEPENTKNDAHVIIAMILFLIAISLGLQVTRTEFGKKN